MIAKKQVINMSSSVFKIILHKSTQFMSITRNKVMIYIYNDVILHWIKD